MMYIAFIRAGLAVIASSMLFVRSAPVNMPINVMCGIDYSNSDANPPTEQSLITAANAVARRCQSLVDKLANGIILRESQIDEAKRKTGLPTFANQSMCVDTLKAEITRQAFSDINKFFGYSQQISEEVKYKRDELQNATQDLRRLLCVMNKYFVPANVAVSVPAQNETGQEETSRLIWAYAVMYRAHLYNKNFAQYLEKSQC